MIRNALILVGLPLLLGLVAAVTIGLALGTRQWTFAAIAFGLCVPPGLVTLLLGEYLIRTSPFGRVIAVFVGTFVRLVVAFGGGVLVFALAGPTERADRVAFWLWVLFALVTPALVLERCGVGAAFGRSKALINGAWWRTFGVLLLTAGHETSASMLALGTLTLLCNQEQRARLCADLSLMDNAVEELLRYLTIFQFGVPRTALGDVEITGRVVRAGESVTVSLPAANRDPARFTAPDELDLGRRAQGHLAFGFGVHQCVGQHLARLELAVGFRALLTRFPDLRLAGPLDTVKLAANQGFYGVHELPVIW